MDSGPDRLYKFFTGPLLRYFLLASLLVSVFTVCFTDLPHAWKKREFMAATQWIYKQSVHRPGNSVFVEPADEYEEFSFPYYSMGPSSLDVLEGIGILVFSFLATVLLLPSVLATTLFSHSILAMAPGLDPASYQMATSVAIIYFNSYYWVTLAFLIDLSFDHYSFAKPASSDSLSIL